jgi:SSS family solute:Na+ symporter
MQIALNTFDLIVIGFYLVALLYIGFRSGKKKTNTDDLFLGGRNLTWPKIGFSLFSTNVSPMMLIGFAGLAYSQGMVGANFEWLAWIYMMVLAMVFIPHYQKNKISTMPGFLDLRFGKQSHRFLSYYSLVSIAFIWLGCTLYAGGLIIAQAIGIPLYISVIGIAVVAVSYTAIGGLAAVVRTDVFQSLLILFGSAVLTILAFLKIGSVDDLYHGVPEHFWSLFKSSDDPDYPWQAVIFGYAVVAIFFFCIDQTIVQKVLAAKSKEDGQKGVLFTAFLKILMPVIFILPGIMAVILYPDLKNTDEAYLRIVTGILPVGLIGLMVAVMLAALINTIAAGLNSFSTVFTLDVYKQMNPEASEHKTKNVGQMVTLLVAVVAICLSILFSLAGKDLFEISQGLLNFFAPPLSVVFIVGVLWKRATPKAAEVTLWGGGLLSVIVGVAYFSDFPHAGFWPNFLILSFYLFLVLLVLMITVSLLTKPVPEKALPPLGRSLEAKDQQSARTIRMLWLILGLIMIGLYIFFN